MSDTSRASIAPRWVWASLLSAVGTAGAALLGQSQLAGLAPASEDLYVPMIVFVIIGGLVTVVVSPAGPWLLSRFFEVGEADSSSGEVTTLLGNTVPKVGGRQPVWVAACVVFLAVCLLGGWLAFRQRLERAKMRSEEVSVVATTQSRSQPGLRVETIPSPPAKRLSDPLKVMVVEDPRADDAMLLSQREIGSLKSELAQAKSDLVSTKATLKEVLNGLRSLQQQFEIIKAQAGKGSLIGSELPPPAPPSKPRTLTLTGVGS